MKFKVGDAVRVLGLKNDDGELETDDIYTGEIGIVSYIDDLSWPVCVELNKTIHLYCDEDELELI